MSINDKSNKITIRHNYIFYNSKPKEKIGGLV